MAQEGIDPSLWYRCTEWLATIIQSLCLIHRSTILDVFTVLFKQARVYVVIKSGMLSMSSPDCVTACKDRPNFFRLQVDDSSSGFGEHSFVEFVHRGHTERGEMVDAKLCVCKCNVTS
jgi:hypothetical protein